MHRFTTEFGMGSGGSNALCSSSNPVGICSCFGFSSRIRSCAESVRRLGCCFCGSKIFVLVCCLLLLACTNTSLFGCYMVKPHGQLVLVSSTPHSAYTPSLSTL